MKGRVYLAVDLGASAGRVLAGALDGGRLELAEVSRFPNGPVKAGGRLYWRTFDLWANVLAGLREAAKRYGDAIASVGVDTWGVDFGLLDRSGELWRTLKSSGGIAIHQSGEFPGLAMEFWAIRG